MEVAKVGGECFRVDSDVTVLANEHSAGGIMMEDVSAGEGIHILTDTTTCFWSNVKDRVSRENDLRRDLQSRCAACKCP
jgi:hypothetical protein